MLSQQSKELMLPLLLALLSLFMQCTQKEELSVGEAITQIQSLLKERTEKAFEQAQAKFRSLPQEEVDSKVFKDLETQFTQFETDLKDFEMLLTETNQELKNNHLAAAKLKVEAALEKFPKDAEALELQNEIEERLAPKKSQSPEHHSKEKIKTPSLNDGLDTPTPRDSTRLPHG